MLDINSPNMFRTGEHRHILPQQCSVTAQLWVWPAAEQQPQRTGGSYQLRPGGGTREESCPQPSGLCFGLAPTPCGLFAPALNRTLGSFWRLCLTAFSNAQFFPAVALSTYEVEKNLQTAGALLCLAAAAIKSNLVSGALGSLTGLQGWLLFSCLLPAPAAAGGRGIAAREWRELWRGPFWGSGVLLGIDFQVWRNLWLEFCLSWAADFKCCIRRNTAF